MADKSVIASLQAQIDPLSSGQETSRRKKASKDTAKKEAALDSEAAFKKIVALVNVSERSEKSVRERLAQAGFKQDDIDDAMERAMRYSLVDDSRFADILIRSRIAQGKGSAGIAKELSGNGIEAESVAGWPHEYPLEYDDELDRALGVLDRKPPRSKNLREGAYRRLMQKGYPSTVAASAARMWAESKTGAN